ncbi:FAD binding domain-containing protein [Chloroflexota bacterium]
MNGSYLKVDHQTPKTIKDACSLLSKHGGKAKIMAGGTDLLVSLKNRTLAPGYIIDIKALPKLSYINDDGKGLKIGAMTTIHEIETSPVIQEKFPVLAQSARQIGSPQVRYMATIGGNICRAAPSADMAPALIGLGATAKIAGLGGQRTVPIEEFFCGPGECVLKGDEIVTEFQVPNQPPYTVGIYLKWTPKVIITIAVIGVAAVLSLDAAGTTITDAKIVLGAVAPTPVRATKAENILRGQVISDQLIDEAAQAAAKEAKPISDIRSPANYRKKMVKELTAQAIRQVTGA